MGDNLEQRIARAEVLLYVGELSSATQALKGAELVLGSRHILDTLQDKSQRPRNARVFIPPALANFRPRVPFVLDGDMLARNFR